MYYNKKKKKYLGSEEPVLTLLVVCMLMHAQSEIKPWDEKPSPIGQPAYSPAPNALHNAYITNIEQ